MIFLLKMSNLMDLQERLLKILADILLIQILWFELPMDKMAIMLKTMINT